MSRPEGMEEHVAGTGFITAGFVLSALLVLASCDAPPPRAAKAIAPPKPEITAKTATVPEPKSEPQIVASRPQPSPRPEPTGKPSPREIPSVQPARHVRHGGVAQNSRSYRYGGQAELRPFWPHDRAERPMNGPVTADREPGAGCDEACRYRAWFRDYNAWYQAYGHRYAEYPPAPLGPGSPAPSAGYPDRPRTAYQPSEARAQSERDRLDPWHGYDGHDGPQNGY